MKSKSIVFLLILLALPLSGKSFEVRAYLRSIQDAQEVVQSLGAEYKGDYLCTEYVYVPDAHNIDLDNEFIRLRDYAYQTTGWGQKKVCLVHKKRELPELTRKTVYSFECDTLGQAQEKLKPYTLLCSYSRKGWEYHLHGMKMYIEDIQGISPSIEIIGQEREDIDAVLKQLPVEKVVFRSLPHLVYANLK